MELILPEIIVKEITLHAIKKFQVNESRYSGTSQHIPRFGKIREMKPH